MRLRELHEQLLAIIPHLDLKYAPTSTVISGSPGVSVTNWPEVQAAIDDIDDLGHFRLELEAIRTSSVIEAGGRGVFTGGELSQANALLAGLRLALKRLATTLAGVVPEIRGSTAFAVRIPAGNDLQSVKASIDALVALDHAVTTLTGERLAFGGFDVGSHWVNVVLEVAGNALAGKVVSELFDAGVRFAKEVLRKRRLVREAEADGFAAPNAEEKLAEVLRRDLREMAERAAKSAKPSATTEDVSRVALGLGEIARIFEHGGEVRGLLTKGDDGADRPPTIKEPLQIEGEVAATKFLPAKAEDLAAEEPPPPSSKKTGSA